MLKMVLLLNPFSVLCFFDDDDDEKRYLFTTQIIEHSAHSLLIRVDNGLF